MSNNSKKELDLASLEIMYFMKSIFDTVIKKNSRRMIALISPR